MKYFLVLSIILGTYNASAAMTYSSVHSMAKNILRNNDYGLTNTSFSDIKEFCPNYGSLSQDERENFWAHLATNITRYESSFNPEDKFMENNGNESRGLLQISYKSISKSYSKNGCNVIKSAEDLMDAEKNLKCGFAIISTLSKSDSTISTGRRGASRYWSTLRTPYQVHVKALNKTVTVGKKKDIISNLKGNYSICF